MYGMVCTAKFLTNIYLSEKIVHLLKILTRFLKKIFSFLKIWLVFSVLTLLPG